MATQSDFPPAIEIEPFLADMERKLGMKVNAFFARDYAGVIQGMLFNKVQLAWCGNKSAIEAVDRADGEVSGDRLLDPARHPGVRQHHALVGSPAGQAPARRAAGDERDGLRHAVHRCRRARIVRRRARDLHARHRRPVEIVLGGRRGDRLPPEEGIRATGANAPEEVFLGVIPQVIPLWVSYMLYRFETNVRAATVVGIVGAGGIGVVLWELIRGFYISTRLALR